MRENRQGYIKTEMESKINKLGCATRWTELSEQGTEYWSHDAVRKRGLDEQYPSGENETEEEHRAKLEKIGEYALLDTDLEGLMQPGKTYFYGELDEQGRPHTVDSDGKVRGYKFEERVVSDDEARQNYDNVFAEQMVEQGILDAVSDEIKAREEGRLICDVKMPKDFNQQKDLARYYVGALDYREQSGRPGKFEGAGAERYSERDRKWVEEKKAAFRRQDQGSEQVEFLINGKMFEGFFYPLIRQGFFDSPDGRPAAAILSSDYDDFSKSKVDIAVAVPMGDAEDALQPICFDLTTGYGNGKLSKIKDTFGREHGLADIKYPSTCFKKEIVPLQDVPHFVLCLPPMEFNKFREKLASKELPTREIQDLMSYQIYAQARYWAEYWGGRDDVSDEEKAESVQKFTKIASHFAKKMDLASRGGARFASELQIKHREATRYITELGLL